MNTTGDLEDFCVLFCFERHDLCQSLRRDESEQSCFEKCQENVSEEFQGAENDVHMDNENATETEQGMSSRERVKTDRYGYCATDAIKDPVLIQEVVKRHDRVHWKLAIPIKIKSMK